MTVQQTQERWFSRVPMHPFLFAVYPVIALYMNNTDELSASAMLRPGAGSLLITLALFVILRAAIRHTRKAALVVTILSLAFYVYWGALIKELLVGVELRHGVPVVLSVLIFCVPLTALARWIGWGRGDRAVLTAVANVVALFTVLMVPVQQLTSVGLSNRGVDAVEPIRHPLSMPEIAGDPTSLPDVYFIVLDAYARADTLKEVFNCDISSFVDSMRAKGFFVADQSRASYPWTDQSLAACLNMNYIANLVPPETPIERVPLGELFRDNAVHDVFSKLGYTLVATETGVPFTEPQSEYDSVMSYAQPWWALTQFEIKLLDFTPLPRLLGYVGIDFGYANWRRQLVHVLENLHTFSENYPDDPVFVQAHLVCPHRPFVFEADGSLIGNPLGTFDLTGLPGMDPPFEKVAEQYANQVHGLNIHVEALVDRILATAKTPPVIAIVGDHGTNTTESNYPGTRDLSTLFMLYLPGDGDESIRQDVNLVELFPLILNNEFGFDLPMPTEPE